MQTHQLSGDVAIHVDHQGLTFAVQPERIVSFATERSSKVVWLRTLTSLVMAVGFFAIPTLSRAATYTGADVVAQTNAVRTEHGLSALSINASLTAAATAKANDMLTKNYFGHYSPTGTAPWAFFKQAGYSFTAAGENLAADYVDGNDIVPAWMASQSHRANILNPAYRDIGLVVVDGTLNGSPTTLVVQFFGSRTSPSAVITSPIAPKVAPVTTPKPTPVATKPLTVVPTIPVLVVPEEAQPAFIPAPEPVEPLPPITEQLAEVKGVATRVIPSLPQSSIGVNRDLALPILVLTTLAFYVTLLTGAGLMSGVLGPIKKSPESTFRLQLA